MDTPERIDVRLLNGRPILFSWRKEIYQVVATLCETKQATRTLYTLYTSAGTVDVIQSGENWFLARVYFDCGNRSLAKKRR